MKKAFWSSEKILSLSALLISLLTFVVFLYQTNLIRKQQYMSVFPYMSMDNGGTNTDQYKFLIVNNGIGPAIIKSLKVVDKAGNNYPDIIDYVQANLTPKDSVGYYYSNIAVGRLIPEKEVIKVIDVVDNSVKSGRKLFEILNDENLLIEIEYESIYGEKWLITNKIKIPQKK